MLALMPFSPAGSGLPLSSYQTSPFMMDIFGMAVGSNSPALFLISTDMDLNTPPCRSTPSIFAGSTVTRTSDFQVCLRVGIFVR